ncbi:HD superfamily phosphodiesterase [Saccharothrix tamanrassetensis]|uniref:HD superfamily phosphodiesterase n=1 Tax=Saccharothrix tamanrassetensis TaxID=1051531 RepID=A0A841CLS1_9PSEU|nr:HD domain-containing protein [Saccharothrix tamanrassetensis]MBB5957108.1 HD superfamily phosphodiesterase [Saccharothrix tamanrassetensis]
MDFFSGADSKAARAAFEVCDEYAEPWLRNHSLRAYSWAAAYGAATRVDYDGELLYVAALLHDLALTPPFDSHTMPFEEAGAHLARVFATGAGWSVARRNRLAEIIVLHMRDDVEAREDPESHLLQVAVSADVSGRRLDEFSPEFKAELLERLPRLGFAPAFLAKAEDQAERKPGCAAADLMRSGWPERVLTNPLDPQ